MAALGSNTNSFIYLLGREDSSTNSFMCCIEAGNTKQHRNIKHMEVFTHWMQGYQEKHPATVSEWNETREVFESEVQRHVDSCQNPSPGVPSVSSPAKDVDEG